MIVKEREYFNYENNIKLKQKCTELEDLQTKYNILEKDFKEIRKKLIEAKINTETQPLSPKRSSNFPDPIFNAAVNKFVTASHTDLPSIKSSKFGFEIQQ